MEMKPGDFAAFPIQASDAQGSLYAEQGITKREYIAAHVLAAFYGSSDLQTIQTGIEDKAKWAVDAADGLLAVLNSTAHQEAKQGE